MYQLTKHNKKHHTYKVVAKVIRIDRITEDGTKELFTIKSRFPAFVRELLADFPKVTNIEAIPGYPDRYFATVQWDWTEAGDACTSGV
jgi:hypothetical protein